jgi:hypothetical protein
LSPKSSQRASSRRIETPRITITWRIFRRRVLMGTQASHRETRLLTARLWKPPKRSFSFGPANTYPPRWNVYSPTAKLQLTYYSILGMQRREIPKEQVEIAPFAENVLRDHVKAFAHVVGTT